MSARIARARGAVALAAASALLLLAGCSSAGGVEGVANDPNQQYVSGTGETWYDAGGRGAAADFTATAISGEHIDTSALRGKVVVLNFWYATCPPCRTEAPLLNEVAGQYASDQVVFLGVNLRDDAATARSFEKTFDVPYDSVLDADTGDVQLAYAGVVPPGATPSTLVLDKEGRVAARMLGELQSAALLGGYVDAALEEK